MFDICYDEGRVSLSGLTTSLYITGYIFLQVRPVAEDEMFRVLKSGKRKKKSWKRMVTKVTFVGQGFTRKPPKYERFIRPSGECNSLLQHL